jgi:hypothetical protein
MVEFLCFMFLFIWILYPLWLPRARWVWCLITGHNGGDYPFRLGYRCVRCETWVRINDHKDS